MIFSSNCKLFTTTVIGVLLSLNGSLLLACWSSLFDTLLNQELALTRGSKSYELWEETPIPLYINFYFFNWTNSANFSKLKYSKPELQELGPYVFREQRRKVVLDWDDKENHTITFLQNRTWVFEPTLSNGSLDDVLTTINIPAVSAAFATRNENFFIKRMLNIAMAALGTKLVVSKRVREFVFEGYNDPLMNLGSILPANMLSTAVPFDKFGWFYTRNGSANYDGIFNMFTGKDDITKFGRIREWNHVKATEYYPSYCGHVNGSAGEFFPPNRDKTSISLFSPDICRTITLNFKEEVNTFGVDAYRYWGDENMFSNVTAVPDNWCFCGSQKCPPNGAVDVSTCKWGAPAYVSFPHFYLADPWYRDGVSGMKPDPDKHQMFIDLEPRTGIPLKVAAALQINILLQPWKEYSLLRDVPTIYFPTLWFTQTAQISDEMLPQVKLLTILPLAGSVFSMVLLIIGATLILIVGLYYITQKWRKRTDTENLKSIIGVIPVSEMKKGLLSTLRSRILEAHRCWRFKMQPEYVVTCQNGTRIVHYTMPKIQDFTSDNRSTYQLSHNVNFRRDSKERSPLQYHDDTYH